MTVITMASLVLGFAASTPALAVDEEAQLSKGVQQETFEPGPNTLVKFNQDYSGPVDSAEESESGPASPISPRSGPRPPVVKNVKHMGQVCSTKLIQQTSGHGKTTLVLTVDKSVSATTKAEMSVSKGVISAGVGWDTTKSYTISNQTRYEVPKGKFGTVEAYALMDLYDGQIYLDGGSLKTGKHVLASKPVGVCFNQYLS
ncbi:hypothetical protein [Streptomyces sp. ITFR-16]|uniref:hypothetical protein n=1 Tax=Streptomyces sp. ITFR-16 TaxID=3075198 RepID=UPI002889164B|nr:hypothetical protein [Streptomyces sp. ITFR-16]WNI22258.1 hypothetical protein RLT58_10080 [Streptomyces sp. ITFR-16]